jgi:hypothetical protein
MPKKPSRPPRPGLDDKRYRESRRRLKLIGNHICAWCGYPIDLQLKWPHPLAWTCDHKTPRAHLTPDDPRHWHIDALTEAHARCNSARGAKPLPQAEGLDPSIDW